MYHLKIGENSKAYESFISSYSMVLKYSASSSPSFFSPSVHSFILSFFCLSNLSSWSRVFSFYYLMQICSLSFIWILHHTLVQKKSFAKKSMIKLFTWKIVVQRIFLKHQIKKFNWNVCSNSQNKNRSRYRDRPDCGLSKYLIAFKCVEEWNFLKSFLVMQNWFWGI